MKDTQKEINDIDNKEFRDTIHAIKNLKEEVENIKNEIKAHKKTTKNSIKLSIIVGVTCFFFVALNLSILFTIAGGIAGSERKLQSLQEQTLQIKKEFKNIKSKD